MERGAQEKVSSTFSKVAESRDSVSGRARRRETPRRHKQNRNGPQIKEPRRAKLSTTGQ